MSILPAIVQRESKRAYLPTPVPAEMVAELINAFRWAPSCRNYQPWRLIAVQSREGVDKLAPCLAKGNEWAAAAPLAMIVYANPKDDATIDEKPYYLFDCGLAVQNLLLQATELGLRSHPTAGWSEPAIRAAFGIGEEERVVCVVFLGFPGTEDLLDPETKAKDAAPRHRKPADTWVTFA
ncbi:nitroreductase [Heliobacterium gestii]|uniref:Nitroreductase n=1 Tax=Heliomicrobium gestii TaxID=2699 RepID=A0A845LBA3_HELGE|nr:nitroreductase family protein [Heliomicrobium gestii]MBM7867674.1 nitroreductase [Heliomicrobium gestii]MZP44067.1 nitroreductase [Heliomicrobium gestii]